MATRWIRQNGANIRPEPVFETPRKNCTETNPDMNLPSPKRWKRKHINGTTILTRTFYSRRLSKFELGGWIKGGMLRRADTIQTDYKFDNKWVFKITQEKVAGKFDPMIYGRRKK